MRTLCGIPASLPGGGGWGRGGACPGVSVNGRREPVLTPVQHRVPAVEGRGPLKMLPEPQSGYFSVTWTTGALSGVSHVIAPVVQKKKWQFFPFAKSRLCSGP